MQRSKLKTPLMLALAFIAGLALCVAVIYSAEGYIKSEPPYSTTSSIEDTASPAWADCIFPRHLYEGGTAFVFCESGTKINISDLKSSKNEEGLSFLKFAQFRVQKFGVDGTRCKAYQCFRFRVKGLHPTPRRLPAVVHVTHVASLMGPDVMRDSWPR